MKKILSLLCLLPPLTLQAQDGYELSGTLRDGLSGEALMGVYIVVDGEPMAESDMDGNFVLTLVSGTHLLKFSLVGYKDDSLQVAVNKNLNITHSLYLIQTETVVVTADIVTERKTPLAVSKIDGKELQEEIAGRDIVNATANTPSVYATQGGGGAGESRVNVRGFDQRNVAVLIDGMPVNDMTNGQVYWSNWIGLDAVTEMMQIQRGLSATKLALPAVGGTMNIITRGMNTKQGLRLRQEVGSFGYSSTNLLLSTGRLKGDWSLTLGGTYRRADGFADGTAHKAYFWFGRLDKDLGKHHLALIGMGTWQESQQRAFVGSVEQWSKTYATELYRRDGNGAQLSNNIQSYGLDYNSNWGYLNTGSGQEIRHQRINQYHKPQISLRDYWTISSRLFWSNVLYMSMGKGGSTQSNTGFGLDLSTGQYNFQGVWDENTNRTKDENGEIRVNRFLRRAHNDHMWYGLLSTLNYKLTEKAQLSGGVDVRDYTGRSYRTIYDVLGGNYYRANTNESDPGWTLDDLKRYDGQKFGYDYNNLVRWGGLFGQVEYMGKKWTAHATLSGAMNGYKRRDYYRRDLHLADTIIHSLTANEINRYNNVGYTYQGRTYHIDDPEVKVAETDWNWFSTFVIKGGASYKVNEHQQVYANAGFFSKAPRFDNVYYFDNRKFRDIKNEQVRAIEGGYNFYYASWTLSVNAYYTTWLNKPVESANSVEINGETFRYNINGLAARHTGLELEGKYNLSKSIQLDANISLGDWIWTSGDTVRITDDNGNEVAKEWFSAKGVHVGDAPQTQLGGALRYTFQRGVLKGVYIKPRLFIYDRHWANFDPLSLGSLGAEGNADRESWRAPGYMLLHCFAGYRFRMREHSLNLQAGCTNLLNTVYVADARNNNNGADFDAKSAGIFLGLGRQFSLSLTLEINSKKNP